VSARSARCWAFHGDTRQIAEPSQVGGRDNPASRYCRCRDDEVVRAARSAFRLNMRQEDCVRPCDVEVVALHGDCPKDCFDQTAAAFAMSPRGALDSDEELSGRHGRNDHVIIVLHDLVDEGASLGRDEERRVDD
jgi:hypothetical protein